MPPTPTPTRESASQAPPSGAVSRLSAPTTRLLHASHTLSSLEAALSALVLCAMRAGAARIAVTLNAASLRFSVADDAKLGDASCLHASLAPSAASGPASGSRAARRADGERATVLGALCATSAVELLAGGTRTHARFGRVLESCARAPAAGAAGRGGDDGADGTFETTRVTVWETFAATPVRRRIEAARPLRDVCAAVTAALQPLALVNAQVALCVRDAEHVLLGTTGGLRAATPDLLAMLAVSDPPSARWLSAAVALKQPRFELRARALVAVDGVAPRLLSLDGAPLSSDDARAAHAAARKAVPAYVVDMRAHPRVSAGELVALLKPDGSLEKLARAAVRAALHGPRRPRPGSSSSSRHGARGRPRSAAAAFGAAAATQLQKRPRFAEALPKPVAEALLTASATRFRPMRRRPVSAPARPHKRPPFEPPLRASVRGFGVPAPALPVVGAASSAAAQRFEQRATRVTRDSVRALRVVGQVGHEFIMATDGHTLFAIDQHAASERHTFERLLSRARRARGGVAAAPLRTPARWRLPARLANAAIAHGNALRRWGWRLCMGDDDEGEGGGVAAMRGATVSHVPCVPTARGAVVLSDVAALTQALSAMADGAPRDQMPRPVVDAVAMAACHAAVRFGDALSRAQCESVVQALGECDNPFVCAHGRPSIAPVAVFEHVGDAGEFATE